jgi:alpha-glucuronidase
MRFIVCILFVFGVALGVRAEDGHDLWLPKRPARPVTIVCAATSPVLTIARQELTAGWQGVARAKIVLQLTKDKEIKDDGFRLRSGAIEARTDAGILYGVFEVLRRQQTGRAIGEGLYNPSYKRRMLDHWDNPDGSIERGYAGHSIFWRKTDPFTVTDSDRMRWTEYARADASIGINCAVLNNVNASVLMLSPDYLARLKAIADVLRPYGIKSYMAVRFCSPVQMGGL